MSRQLLSWQGKFGLIVSFHEQQGFLGIALACTGTAL